MTHKGWVDAFSKYLCPVGIISQSWVGIHISSNWWISLYHIIPFTHLPGWEWPLNLVFCILVFFLLMVMAQGNTYWIAYTYASRSYSLLAYIPKQGFEALQKQWFTFLATYHPIFQTGDRPEIIHCSAFLAAKSDGSSLIWHIRGR